MQELYQEDYSSLSLKLIALQMYSDELKGLDCSTCTNKEKYNCSMEDKSAQVFYNEHLDIDINTCPLNCILKGHYLFHDKYIYYSETSAVMPPYEQCDALFWGMYKQFSQYKNIAMKNK